MTGDFEEVARGFGREPHLRRVVLPLKAIHERESLMSIVYRTAERTELTPGHIILSAGYPHRQTFNMAVTELQRAPDLAYVLGVAEGEVRARIYAETFHSGRGCTFVDFAGASVPATLLNVRERKIAPAALEDRPFHHLLSEHRLLPFDADTGTFLISRCPECRKRLAWTVVRSFYRCPCGADLRTAPSIAVPEEFVDGATAMAHLLDPRTATHAPAVDALPASIRTMNRGSLFEIGWQTAVAIGFAERPEANTANWPDDCKVRTLHLAARLLANWPASAEAAFAEIASTEHRRRAVTSLAALARSTRIPDDVRAGIRSILPPRATATRAASSGRPHGVNLTASERSLRREAYATRGGEGTIVGDRVADSVSMNQACHILGTSIQDTSRMLRTMEPVDALGAHKSRVRYARNDVERLADLIDNRIPIDTLSYRSGISIHGIEQMVCLGHLDRLDEPAILAGYKTPQVDRRSVVALVDWIVRRSLNHEPDGWISLPQAMKAIGGREKPWGPAFTLLLTEQSLPFFWRGGKGDGYLPTGAIIVPPRATEAFRTVAFSRLDHPLFDFDEYLTARDATTILNISDSKFTKIREKHFRGAVVKDGRIAAAAVIAAAQTWVAPGELAARSDRTPHECFTELQRAKLPRTLLGFPRLEAERLMKLVPSDF